MSDLKFDKSFVPARKLLAEPDTGTSWDAILRFKGASFATGGQFKACFCDPDTLADGQFCKSARDYRVELGTVHVSGVSCLIEDPKFQRGTCVEQYYGGLRCYPGAAPMLEVPVLTEASWTPQDAPAGAGPGPALSSYCLYGPEEETRDDPLCG